MRWGIAFLALLACAGGLMLWHMFSAKPQRWAVLYAREAATEALLPYDLLVFDRDGHPDLGPLRDGKRALLGYVSLGEAEIHRKDYAQVKALGVLISGVPGWKGGDFIDVRQEAWRRYLLESIIPAVLAEGFTGIMLDTTDNLLWLEAHDPIAYGGMKAAAAALIKTIRQRYPGMHIMVNRGFDILPEIAGDIDMLLAESIYTSWNLAEGTPGMASEEVQKHYLEKLRLPWWHFPRLKIYSLDYWPPEEVEQVKKIYQVQRDRGFIPYVSTPDLQRIQPYPR